MIGGMRADIVEGALLRPDGSFAPAHWGETPAVRRRVDRRPLAAPNSAVSVASPPAAGSHSSRQSRRGFDSLPGYRQSMKQREPGLSGALPGAEVIDSGVRDLEGGFESVEALLVSIGAPRLRALGFVVSDPIASPELRLYERLREEDPDGAHSRYNALIRRLVSFERAAECAS
jgi:hypothetical protein